MKNIFDKTLSFFGLITLLPVFLIIAILIKVKTPGPVLFKQKRVGRYGNLFTIYKFRTMTVELGGSSALVHGESRITPLGAVLRKYKLDELPELWNVLTGDMSLVGPRPDVPGYADNLKGTDRDILQLKPGITGPATLKYSNEEQLLAKQDDPQKYNDEVIFPDKVKINLSYLQRHNLFTDMKIIFKTIAGIPFNRKTGRKLKMKILYINQYFTFPEGADSTRAYDLSTSFVKKGFDVTVVTTTANIHDIDTQKKGRWIFLEKEGIKFWILKCAYNQKMAIPQRLMAFIKFLWFATFKCLRLKADIVLASSTPLTVAAPALIKKKISGTPYIFEVRDVWPEVPIQLGYVKNKLHVKILNRAERLIYKNASYLVVLSSGMKKCITSRIKKLPGIEIIPNISEVNRFSDLSRVVNLNINMTGKKVILYAGTMGPVNHIIYVAELAKMLKESACDNIIFLIVGDGSQKEDIVKYCVENNLLNVNMFFVDKVPKNALPYLYSIASMGSSFVLDKKILWHNSANKFFDTLAAGKPVLLNYRGWQADMIEENNCGYVLPANLETEAVKAFAAYVNDDKRLKEQGENAKNLALKNFTLEIAVEKYMNVLNKIK